MEPLGERPVWSMSGSEMLSTLDALDADLARRQTYRLHVIAALDDIGYAKEIGAHDTARLLSFRHHIDSAEAHRDVRLARSLPKYTAVSAALPNPTRDPDPAAVLDSTPAPSPDPDRPQTSVPLPTLWSRASRLPAAAASSAGSGDRVGVGPCRSQVAADNLAVAEEQLVGLAAHLSPDSCARQARKSATSWTATAPNRTSTRPPPASS